ncbi:hypothetical protein NLU13_1460 [Sarocladium strictum]|uniref:Beta-glucosidase n=1 Tax=Sarocladium strictum TaxID=5046 RepID=A0AA39GTT9_SARSR|nr:hypothetical protein NLU13_1460 [Sarocladium strictum]
MTDGGLWTKKFPDQYLTAGRDDHALLSCTRSLSSCLPALWLCDISTAPIMFSSAVLQIALVVLVTGQQIYVPAEGPAARPACKHGCHQGEPSFKFGQFAYTMSTTVRTATPVPSPTATPTYAPPPEQATSLLTSPSYTTWGKWNPTATTKATDTNDPYGEAAWTALWEHADPPDFTDYTSVYSTTVSPTPIPSSELVLPPDNYFGPTDCYNFPEGFSFGVASSACQVEGATADHGKAPTLQDILVRDERPKDYVTNEVYYYYKQDIARLAAMGVKRFSFSLAWSRILPFALPGTPVNQAAIDHYNDVINFILEQGMIPDVTLLHFDTPLQFFGDNLTQAAEPPEIGYVNGGWANETFVDAFVNYAQVAMTHFADRVPVWFTFNEPLLYSSNGRSVYNVLQSHARVAHWYREELKATGQLAVRLNNNFGVPRDPHSEADVRAADNFNSFQLGPFANPIYLGEDYPESYKQTIHDHVPLTADDLAYMNGTADFIGVNPYTATVVTPPAPGDAGSILDCAHNTTSPFRPYCVNQTTVDIHGWDIGYRSQTYVYITPTYLRSYLNYVYDKWRHPIKITEFGFPVWDEASKPLPDQLHDLPRSIYLLSYLSEILKAVWEDGVEVTGAYLWSYADNWEFGDYDAHFGVQTVNRTTQERNFKKSFFDAVDFVKARGVQ